MTKTPVAQLMLRARKAGTVIPGFNIPYLPMMEPVVRALRDTRCFGLIMVARLEWMKFQSKSIRHIRDEYERVKDESVTRLHLDHVPVIDEDNQQVDFMADLSEAVELGYDSVMVDGSRLSLEENIDCTRRIVEIAHQRHVPVEAELGAVLGHEAGPLPPYDELFATGRGFTDPVQARRFVSETGVDWLSVAVGSVHGAISAAQRTQKKVEARLSIDHLDRLRQAVDVPLVLHGGTGIQKSYIMDAIHHGIAKINIATAIRQPYEAVMGDSVAKGQDVVYRTMLDIIRHDLEIENSASLIAAQD